MSTITMLSCDGCALETPTIGDRRDDPPKMPDGWIMAKVFWWAPTQTYKVVTRHFCPACRPEGL